MTRILGHWYQRLHRLGGPRRQLLVRAAVILTAASAAVALLPFRRAIALGSVRLASARSGPAEADCLWAIEAAARRMPWRTMCIEKGLAMQRLLRKSGVDALLHYGGRLDPKSGKLQAHVWVTVNGRAVIGGEEAADFNEVAVFP